MDKCIVNIAGYNYDLRPLEKSSGNMVSGKDDYDYYFNFCEPIVETPVYTNCLPEKAVAYVTHPVNGGSTHSHDCYSVGRLSSITASLSYQDTLTETASITSPDSGIVLTMNNPSAPRRWPIVIHLVCNDTFPYELETQPFEHFPWTRHKYQISWNTPHGCPIKDVDDSHNESTKSIGPPDESVNIQNVIQDSGYINHHNVTLNVTDRSCNTVYSIDEVICYGVRLYRNGISGRKLIESFDNTICIFTFWLIVTNKRLHIVDDERKFAKDIIKWFIQLRLMSWLITTYPH